MRKLKIMDKYFKKYNEIVNGNEELLELSGYVAGDEEYLYHHMLHEAVTADLTPIHNFYENHNKNVQSHVLITSGSFSPMHSGHVELAREAIKAVEGETGETVIGCWYSIDHSDYVNDKKMVKEYTTMERVNHAQKLIDGDDNLNLDYWSALYAPTDVNFTTVYERFNNYIHHNFPEHHIKLWYVVGGDHMEFLNAFSEFGSGVGVPRGGYDNDLVNVTPEALERCIHSKNITKDISSTSIRSNSKITEGSPVKAGTPLKYLLRNDIQVSLENTLIAPFISDYDEIYGDITGILKKYLPHDVEISETIFTTPRLGEDEKIISLDPFTIGDYNLHPTRIFKAFGGQYENIGHSHRVEHEPLEEQLGRIPKGLYHLMDDDIITGNTVQMVKELLEESGVTVGGFHSLTNIVEAYDVVDCRDFIVGSNYGGLTVNYMGGNYRTPYIFPHVNLNSRAKISPVNILPLSIELWWYNYELYRSSGVLLKDLANTLLLPGGDDSMEVSGACLHYHKLLKNIYPRTS